MVSWTEVATRKKGESNIQIETSVHGAEQEQTNRDYCQHQSRLQLMLETIFKMIRKNSIYTYHQLVVQ